MPQPNIDFIPLAEDNCLTEFYCGDSEDYRDLSNFICNDALRYQNHHIGTTKLISVDNAIVGFLTLCSSEVVLKTWEFEKLIPDVDRKTFPAVKLARVAIQKDRQRGGIGRQIVNYIIGWAIKFNESVGCRFIVVDPIPDSVAFYEEVGFTRNKSGMYRNRKFPSFRLDILTDLQ